MPAIRATIVNGQIVPDAPVEWPDGTVLEIQPAEAAEPLGIREEDWPTTPEGIEEWIAWYDSLEPFMTPEQEAEWRRVRQEDREWQLAYWEERCRKIEKHFE